MKIPSQLTLLMGTLLLASACRRDMQDQPKYKALGQSRFFADGRESRPVPAGTIARDELDDTDPVHTGSAQGSFLETIPLPVTAALLKRGRDRFNIYCSPCHGETGNGYGMVRQRGFWIPANLHTDRLRSVPPGYIYQLITNGYGAMPDHGDQIPFGDRWAIVAYLRALQLSRNASVSDLSSEARRRLEDQQQTSGEVKPAAGAKE